MDDLKRVVRLVREKSRFLIVSHVNPDADAVGSILALGLALRNIGKKVVIYNRGGVPQILRFLPGSHLVRSSLTDISSGFHATFVLDCADMDRAGDEFQEYLGSDGCGTTVLIDHHETNSSSADLSLLDPDSSSTGMIVYSLLKELSFRITPDIAENIYTTIVSDTGSFGYSNTSPETFRVAAELVELGASPAETSQALFESEPLRKLKLLGFVLPTLEITEDGHIAWVMVDRAMYEATGASREDTDGMVNFPRSIDGVRVAVLFRDEGDDNNPEWKVSLRSKGETNVARVAKEFGGGGHRQAAGCTVAGEFEQVKRRVISRVGKALT